MSAFFNLQHRSIKVFYSGTASLYLFSQENLQFYYFSVEGAPIGHWAQLLSSGAPDDWNIVVCLDPNISLMVLIGVLIGDSCQYLGKPIRTGKEHYRNIGVQLDINIPVMVLPGGPQYSHHGHSMS